MLIRPLIFVFNCITALNNALKQLQSTLLTKSQRAWLVTILMGLIVSNSFNWAAFERHSQGAFKQSRLRWIFRHAAITVWRKKYKEQKKAGVLCKDREKQPEINKDYPSKKMLALKLLVA